MFIIIRSINMSTIFICCFVLFIHSVQAVPLQKDVPKKGRIIGGNYTDIYEYPYQASIEYFDVPKCGGTIIARTWILTAAHCVLQDRVVSGITVRAGTSYYGTGGQTINAKAVIRHPNFSDPIVHDCDIALIQLEQPIFLSLYARIIGLPNNGNGIGEGRLGTVTGWGITEENEVSLLLQVVHIPIISQSVCQDLYETTDIITERMFCAGSRGGGKGPCSGDDGGPLVTNSVLTGIVSWSYSCADPEIPDVYTNVGAFRDWITDITGI